MANLIFYVGPTDQTLYLRIKNPAGNYVATALTEGGTGADGTYTAAESTIAALTGMSSASTGNGCAYTVRTGSASTSAEDSIVASGFLPWSGSAELSATAQILAATNGSDTVGTQLQRLDDEVSSVAASGTPTDLATEGISSNLTFVLVPGANGPRSQDRKHIIIGTPGAAYAVDFKNVAAVGQKIYTVDSIEVVSGDDSGLTFNASDAWERDGGTQARFVMAGAAVGEYTVRVKVTYTNSRPGRGDILVKVVD